MSERMFGSTSFTVFFTFVLRSFFLTFSKQGLPVCFPPPPSQTTNQKNVIKVHMPKVSLVLCLHLNYFSLVHITWQKYKM